MNILKNICKISFWCLVITSFIMSLIFGYYHFFVKGTTMGTNNINDQLGVDIKKSDELTEEEKNEYEERFYMEARYYSNSKQNGIELQELKYNSFTSYKLTSQDYRSTGMQFLGDFETYSTNGTENDANNKVLNEFYYYDTTNGITWSGFKGQYGSVGTVLNRNQTMIIKIDNRPFSIQLTGSYTTGWWIFGTTTYFDYGDVFDCVFSAIKSNDKGFGDYYITLDLSQYFTIKEYDQDTGDFKKDNVTDIIKNYSVLKFHYDENGARNSTQSLFGIIECNSKYDLEDNPTDTTYWQEKVVYNLNESLLTPRYSDVYNGKFLSASMDLKKDFKAMPRAKINISIDLDNIENIVGLDFNAFDGLIIDTLQITSSKNIDFKLLDSCLANTKIKTLKYTETINLIISDTAFNNDYVGVII